MLIHVTHTPRMPTLATLTTTKTRLWPNRGCQSYKHVLLMPLTVSRRCGCVCESVCSSQIDRRDKARRHQHQHQLVLRWKPAYVTIKFMKLHTRVQKHRAKASRGSLDQAKQRPKAVAEAAEPGLSPWASSARAVHKSLANLTGCGAVGRRLRAQMGAWLLPRYA